MLLTHPPVSEAPAPEISGPKLTLVDHLEELRRRLGISLAVLLVAIGISASQVDRLIAWLRRPAEGRRGVGFLAPHRLRNLLQ